MEMQIVLRKNSVTMRSVFSFAHSYTSMAEKIKELLQSGNFKPSDFNIQPWQLWLDNKTAFDITRKFQNACHKAGIIYHTSLVAEDEDNNVGFDVFGKSFIKIKGLVK